MPYWRLSGVYFFYFASVGALFPFWGLYLKQEGFDPLAIGQLMAILMATKIVAPNLWNILASLNSQPMQQVQIATLLSWLAFLGVFWAHSFWHIALIMGLFSFFWSAALPQFEAITFNHLQKRVHSYATIRLWGSVGFIFTVAILGQILEHHGIWVVPVVMLILYIALWLFSLLVPEAASNTHPDYRQEESATLWLERAALLCACFLMQASHGVYYTFYSLHLEQHGYSKAWIGQLWALGVLVELGLFLLMRPLLERYGARRVLIASLILAVLRWLLIGEFPEQIWILIAAQCLHAVTFGSFHASAIHLIYHYFPGRTQRLGQALYSSLGFGAGGAIGSLASGYLWVWTSPAITFMVAASIAFLGAWIAWLWVDPQHQY